MRRQSGFILVATVLILLAFSVTLAAASFASLFGATGRSLSVERGARALALAEGCMEEALFRIREDSGYDGGTVDLGDAECAVDVTRSGEDYAVTAMVTLDSHTRRISAEARRDTSRVTLISWRVQ